MKTVLIILRILGAAAAAFLFLVGGIGLSTGDANGLAIVLLVVAAILLFFSLYRSPAARAESKVRRQARRSERLADAEQARADAEKRARRAAEERQRQEDLRRRQQEAETAAWHEHVRAQQQAEQARPQQPRPEPAQPEYKTRDQLRDERRATAREQGVASCPRCGSTSLSVNKKGYGAGKAILLGPLAGTIGMNKLKVTCLNCGYTFKPGKGRQ